jgi:hypothetical protein
MIQLRIISSGFINIRIEFVQFPACILPHYMIPFALAGRMYNDKYVAYVENSSESHVERGNLYTKLHYSYCYVKNNM